MELEPIVSLKNPWAVDSLDNFSFYCCPECDIRSQNKQEFINHAFLKHPVGAPALHLIKDQTVQGLNFPTNDELKVESDIKAEIDDDEPMDDKEAGESKSDSKKEIHCSNCGLKFPTKYDLFMHRLQEHKVDDETMTDIGYDMDDKKASESKCDSKKDMHCSNCGLKFPTKYDLFMHRLQEHKEPKVTKTVCDTEECLCSLCGKTIIGRKKFIRHEKEKHGMNVKPRKIADFDCAQCNKSISEALEANEHVKECQKVLKNFQCPECDLLWASGPVLSYHLRKDHLKIQNFICDHCGKCFKQKVGHDWHVKSVHDKVKDHVCHLCGLGFTRKQSLQYHISRIHKDSGKHFCDRCPFKTTSKRDLEIHINEVHTKTIKFACDHCNFFCYRKGGLAAHVKNVHLKLKPHRCESCGHAFVRRKELEKHKEMSNH